LNCLHTSNSFLIEVTIINVICTEDFDNLQPGLNLITKLGVLDRILRK